MCTSPADVLSTAAELASINASSDSQRWDPRIVWEPHPKFCVPGQLEAFKEALEFVDVCSPNHEEAAGESFSQINLSFLESLLRFS